MTKYNKFEKEYIAILAAALADGEAIAKEALSEDPDMGRIIGRVEEDDCIRYPTNKGAAFFAIFDRIEGGLVNQGLIEEVKTVGQIPGDIFSGTFDRSKWRQAIVDCINNLRAGLTDDGGEET